MEGGGEAEDVCVASRYSLVPRFISQAFIACSMKARRTFHTASDKSLEDKPGNDASQ